MSSNHTRVNIDEWEAMQRRAREVDAYVISRKEEAERIAELVAQRRRETEAARATNAARIQNSVNSLIDSFNSNVSNLRNQMNSHLREQANAFGTQLERMRNDIRSTSARISSMEQDLNNLARTYNDVFQEYLRMENERGSRANMVSAELERLLGIIDGLNPQRFTPVEYASLCSQYESVRANINSGDSQAALMVSQNSILQATRLLAQLQLLNEQYDRKYADICNRATSVKERIDRLSSKEGALRFEYNGALRDFSYDVDYWSHGRFQGLCNEFEQLETSLHSGRTTLEQLEQIGQALDVLNQNISACDEAARLERVAQISTADTARRLSRGLENSGWSLVESDWDEGDNRNSYVMNYSDSAGSTVSVVVAPESPESPGIFMEVFSDSTYREERIKDGIHETLQREGLEIGQREERNDCHLNPTPEAFLQNALEEAREVLNYRR